LPNIFLGYDKKKLVLFWLLCCYRLAGKNITHLKVFGTLFYVGHFPLSHTLMVYYHEVLDEGNVSAERKEKIALVEGGHKHYVYLNIRNALLGTLESIQNSQGKKDA